MHSAENEGMQTGSQEEEERELMCQEATRQTEKEWQEDAAAGGESGECVCVCARKRESEMRE